jgi:hypothetical protein
MHTTVNRSTKEDEPFASATPLQLQALGMVPSANAAEDQQSALEKLRKQQIRDFKREYRKTVGGHISTNDAVEFFADTLSSLDRGFARGYRKATLQKSANAQQLDWSEWEQRDDDAITEARLATSMTEDVVSAGFAVDTSLARMLSRWAIRSEAFEADRSMDGRNRATDDRPEKAYEGVSLPITHIDYEISQREIQNSMNFGESVDEEAAVEAGETLAVAQEELMTDGWDVDIPIEGKGTFSVDGYRTTDYRITDVAPGPWDTASNVLDTLDEMQQALHGQTDDENRGAEVQDGAWVYYPRAQWSNVTLATDPRGDGNMSIAERIQQDYPWLNLRQNGVLAPDEVLMVVQNSKFVDVADAQVETNFSWDVEGGFGTMFKALNCRIPRIKGTFGPDAESADDAIVGVAHYTGI